MQLAYAQRAVYQSVYIRQRPHRDATIIFIIIITHNITGTVCGSYVIYLTDLRVFRVWHKSNFDIVLSALWINAVMHFVRRRPV